MKTTTVDCFYTNKSPHVCPAGRLLYCYFSLCDARCAARSWTHIARSHGRDQVLPLPRCIPPRRPAGQNHLFTIQYLH